MRPNGPGGQGFNLYSYVANNPSTWTDPTGHLMTEEWVLEEMAKLGSSAYERVAFSAEGSVISCETQPAGRQPSCIPDVFAAIATALLIALAAFAFILVDIWVAMHLLGNPGTESFQPVPEGDEQQADRVHPETGEGGGDGGLDGGGPPPGCNDPGDVSWFHGTNPESAQALFDGAPLDA